MIIPSWFEHTVHGGVSVQLNATYQATLIPPWGCPDGAVVQFNGPPWACIDLGATSVFYATTPALVALLAMFVTALAMVSGEWCHIYVHRQTPGKVSACSCCISSGNEHSVGTTEVCCCLLT
jgi:hypothetical protein